MRSHEYLPLHFVEYTAHFLYTYILIGKLYDDLTDSADRGLGVVLKESVCLSAFIRLFIMQIYYN